MKMKKYIDYFQFIRKNWNLGLAIFTCYHEICGEKKYHLNTTYTNDLRQLEITSGNKKNAYIYQPVNYYMLETALQFLKEQNINGGLVDFGCGMGRILVVASHYGFKDITGVEFSPELCNDARNNLKETIQSFPDNQINIICENAGVYCIKKQEAIFIFFNPFDEVVMLPVVKNILKSFKENPREITVVYFNPTEKEIFLSAGFREVWYYQKMEYLDFSILRLEP